MTSNKTIVITASSLITIAVFVQLIQHQTPKIRQTTHADITTVDSTGAILPTGTPQEIAAAKDSQKLKSLIPYTGSGFNISMDYATDTFKVVLSLPNYNTAQNNFATWLSSRGIINIPQSYFSYTPTPNCYGISGPASLTVGQSGTYRATVTSPGTALAGEINYYNGSINRISYQNLTPPTATISAPWTPPAAGTYSVCCRAWNDSIAECRPANFTGIGGVVSSCLGPNSCMAVSVTAPTPNPTPVLSGSITCTSWTNFWINSCNSSSKYGSNPKDPGCLTSTNAVTLSNNVTNASQFRFQLTPTTKTCTDPSIIWTAGWQTYTNQIKPSLTLNSGDNKICAQFKNSTTTVSCGAIIYKQ